MITKDDFRYYDLRRGVRSREIDLIFPGWNCGDERIAVLSPHDDDGILGAGYAILAALANGGEVYIFIFCDGRAGYSFPEDKDGIVERRREETSAAYRILGIQKGHIVRFDYPDFSLAFSIGWIMPGGGEGTISRVLPALRKLKITRLLIANGYREHIDHEAVSKVGGFDGPQVGDSILVDWGAPVKIKSFLEYPVWGDFSPEDALISGSDLRVRGNRAIKATSIVEETIASGLKEFRSQERVIEGLLRAREGRRREDGYIEVYLAFDPRPALDYSPYHRAIESIDGKFFV
ncbi:MAG: PIG-L deacetylase family protein [bacterium]